MKMYRKPPACASPPDGNPADCRRLSLCRTSPFSGQRVGGGH
jgi:hypothetical protein